MPVTVEEQKESRQFSKSAENGISISRKYLVHSAQDESIDDLESVEGITLGSTYPGYNAIRVREIATSYKTEGKTIVNVTYTNRSTAGSGSIDGPRLGDQVWNYNSEMENAQEYYDNGGDLLNPAGQPVTVPRPRLVANVVHYRSDFPIATFLGLVGKVNDRTWHNGSAGRWLYTGFSGSEYNERMYKIEHNFRYAREGHQKSYVFTKSSTTTPVAGGDSFNCKKPYPSDDPRIIQSEVYESGNLADLGVS